MACDAQWFVGRFASGALITLDTNVVVPWLQIYLFEHAEKSSQYGLVARFVIIIITFVWLSFVDYFAGTEFIKGTLVFRLFLTILAMGLMTLCVNVAYILVTWNNIKNRTTTIYCYIHRIFIRCGLFLSILLRHKFFNAESNFSSDAVYQRRSWDSLE